jgi:hypothetical protein
MKLRVITAALATVILIPVTSAAALPRTGALPRTADSGSIGIRLLEGPAAKRNDPRAKLYIVDNLAAGTTIRRKIGVTNHTASTMRASLYATGATITNGAFTPTAGRGQNEVSGWITVVPASLDIAPGAEAQATVTIIVPKGATNGEQYAAVFAEPPAVQGKNGVDEVNRVGIRVYLSVGNGEPASDFVIESMKAFRTPQGLPAVTAQVKNTGGRALDMSGALRLTKGPGGLQAGPFPAKLGTTLGIGQTEPVSVFLDKALPNGPWLARLDLESGLIKRAATATISFPDKGEAAPVSAKLVEGKKKQQLPWPLIVAGIVGLLLLGLLILFLLKRRSRPEDKRDLHAEVSQH